MDTGKPFCTAPLTWQDGLTRYPPYRSYEWNTISLQPYDYDEDFYNIIVALENRHQKNEFTEADFAHLGLTFSLLTKRGAQYNLIPSGSEIRVTKSNAYEYFQRVHSIYERLRQGLALNQPPPPPTAVPALPRIRSIATGLRLTAHDLPAIEWLRRCACEDPEQLILPPGDKLRWAVVPRSNDFLIRLRPDGEHHVVEPDDLGTFLTDLQVTVDEIHRAIRIFGYYPPNIICAAPAEMLETVASAVANTFTNANTAVPITPNAPSSHVSPTPIPPRCASSSGRIALYASARAAAAAAAAAAGQDRRYIPSVSPEELEKQRALFSPTHDTGNILSPFQEINV